MGCLTDYIGIRWCGATGSVPSNLYINDLPGISIKQISSITDEEHTTFLSLWNTIQARAENRFALDVRESMNAKYRLNSLSQGVNLGKTSDLTPIIVATGESNYYDITLTDNTEFSPSPLMQLGVQSVSWYCGDAGDIGEVLNLTITDVNTSQVLHTQELTIVNIGWNDFEVGQSFVPSTSTPQPLTVRIDISPDASDLTTVEMDLPNSVQFNSCCMGRIEGTASGITTTFNIACSWAGLICQNKNLFSRSFWYLCGIEFLTELIYSSVLTGWTTINLQKAKDLRVEYEVEYQKSLSQVAGGMNLDCDCCLDCGGGIQIRTATQFY